jgi:hypothetical protein
MIKQTKFIAAILSAGILTLGHTGFAADTAEQTINMTVPVVNEITVSGDASLVLLTPTAGAGFADVTNSLTTYAVTTNETAKKITGDLAAPMPTGLTLFVHLNVPSSTGSTAANVAEQDMSDGTAKDLVTGISNVNDASSAIDYRLSATAEAASGSPTATMTFTITDEA